MAFSSLKVDVYQALLLLSGLIMAVPSARCQQTAAPTPSQAQPPPDGTAQSTAGNGQPTYSIAPYDVASIRMYSSNSGNMHVTTGNGSFLAENATLRFMIRFAYDLPEKLLVGGPPWIKEKNFDIKAKTDGVAAIDQSQFSEEQREAYYAQKQIPLQELLADRFRLKMHQEDRVMPFYAIVVAKNGLKMKPSDETSDLDQLKAAGGARLGSGFRIRVDVKSKGRIVAVRATLDQLARYLTTESKDVDRPVLNKTGLTGEYDFTLEWTPGIGVDNGDSAPSLFMAIQEQLGLKLEPQKGHVEVTAIDDVELPSEN